MNETPTTTGRHLTPEQHAANARAAVGDALPYPPRPGSLAAPYGGQCRYDGCEAPAVHTVTWTKHPDRGAEARCARHTPAMHRRLAPLVLTVATSSKSYGYSTGTRHLATADGAALCGTRMTRPTYSVQRAATCDRCRKAAGQAPTGDTTTVLRPDSLLSAKDQRTMNLHQQRRKLATIAKRAAAHAEWMDELARQATDMADVARLRAEEAQAEAKALAAVREARVVDALIAGGAR